MTTNERPDSKVWFESFNIGIIGSAVIMMTGLLMQFAPMDTYRIIVMWIFLSIPLAVVKSNKMAAEQKEEGDSFAISQEPADTCTP